MERVHGAKHRSLRQRRKPLHGFTLIEMLVVISIIAMLIALILPALAKAKAVARAATCMSNQKQIVLSVGYYLSDFKDFFPASYDGQVGNAPPTFWFSKLCYLYLGSTTGGPGNNDIWGTGKGAERLFICPEIPQRGAGGLDRHTEIGYGWNYLALTHLDFTDLSNSGQTANLSKVEKHSQTIVTGDTHDSLPGILNGYVIKPNLAYGWYNFSYMPISRHLTRANYSMVDGHVEALASAVAAEMDDFLWKMKKN